MNHGVRERILAFDMIRTVAALAVFTYHFSLSSGTSVFPTSFLSLQDGLGFVAVSVFFMLSGASLYYTYEKKLSVCDFDSIRQYYIKRARAIYPPFHAVFFALHILRAIKYRSFFYLGKKAVFLLSLVGLDGYFSYETKTYYLVGEWFLGALILIYLMFPLLLYVFQKSRLITTAALGAIYLLTINKRMLSPAPNANIISCLLSFETGMLLVYMIRRGERDSEDHADHAQIKRDHKHVSVVTALSAIILIAAVCITDLLYGLNRSLTGHLYALGVFMLLYIVGILPETGPGFVKSFFINFSEASYLFFLIHHVILEKICRHMNAGRGDVWIFFWYIGSLVIVYWMARILTSVIRSCAAYFVKTCTE